MGNLGSGLTIILATVAGVACLAAVALAVTGVFLGARRWWDE